MTIRRASTRRVHRVRMAAGLTMVAGALLATSAPAQAASDWTVVSAGYTHTCALRVSGKLYCWGSNSRGQLGDGTTYSRNRPKQITSATDWRSVSAGSNHTCAIRGKLYCWGYNGQAQLGDNTTTPTSLPKQITTATDWTSVSAGDSHTCAIRATGKLYCWGSNSDGKVGGLPSGVVQRTPRQITAATDWRAVTAGEYHTCAVRAKLYCWGDNDYGQIGADTGGNDQLTPKQITAAADWRLVHSRYDHTCAIRSKLYCWGSGGQGQIGDGRGGSGIIQRVPKQITSATDWQAVATGAFHTCAARRKLYCWGGNCRRRLKTGRFRRSKSEQFW